MTQKQLKPLPSKPQYSIKWVSDLKDSAQREAFVSHMLSDTKHPVLVRLKKLIAQRLNEIDKQELTTHAYDNPSWSHKQAHLNGARQELTELLDLLNFVH